MTLPEFNKVMTERKRLEHPSVPAHAVPPSKFKETSTNELTKAVIAYLQYHNAQAERISVEGRVIEIKRKTTDIFGNRMIREQKRIPSSGKKGSADISCTFPVTINGVRVGIALKIEIKYGKDKQSDHQKQYQQAIQQADGLYFIVKKFSDIVEVVDIIKNKFTTEDA
jgi:hypothetical protein